MLLVPFLDRQFGIAVEAIVVGADLRLHPAGLVAQQEVDDAAAKGQLVTYALRAEMRARAGYLAHQVLNAISILVNVHGAGSFAESSRMQQYWRDANTAARHAGLQPVVGYEVYGKSLLGIEDRISPAV